MQNQSSLFEVMNALVAKGLPFGGETRILFGDRVSREHFKDQFIQNHKAIPGVVICTLDSLATEVLLSSNKPIPQKLHISTVGDVLQNVGERLRDQIPNLAKHLKKRDTALHLARFMREVDFSVLNLAIDYEILAEHYSKRDPELAQLIQLSPQIIQSLNGAWSDAEKLRQAIICLDDIHFSQKTKLPFNELYIFGVDSLSRLGTEFLNRLAKEVSVYEFLPPLAISLVEWSEKAILPTSEEKKIEISQFHSAWDEVDLFIQDVISDLKNGVDLNKIGVFLPADSVYKNYLLSELRHKNIPVYDATAPKQHLERAQILWWVDFFKSICSHFPLNKARLLGTTFCSENFWKTAYQFRIDKNLKRWSLHPDFKSNELLTVLTKTYEAFKLNRLSFKEFEDGLSVLFEEKCIPELLKSDAVLDFFSSFFNYLKNHRAVFYTYRWRLSEYSEAMLEYLEEYEAKTSYRTDLGLWVNTHGSFVPKQILKSYVLACHTLKPSLKNLAPTYESSAEMRSVWSKIEGTTAAESLWEWNYYAVSSQGSHVNFSFSNFDLNGTENQKPLLILDKLKLNIKDLQVKSSNQIGWSRKNEAIPPGFVKTYAGSKNNLIESIGASAFEDFLKCPHLYWYRHEAKINPLEELSTSLPIKNKGIILHKVLEQMIRSEIDGIIEIQSERADHLLKNILSHALVKSKYEGVLPGANLEKNIENEFYSKLKNWLDFERERRKKIPNLKPTHVEAPFEVCVDGLLIKGRVDRIDQWFSNEYDKEAVGYVVIDYKSGVAPYIGKELRAGLGIQLLLYSHAIENKFKKPVYASMYQTFGREIELKSGIAEKSTNSNLLKLHPRNSSLSDVSLSALFLSRKDLIKESIQQLKLRNFTPTPARGKKECESCSILRFCEQGRLNVKSMDG